MSMALSGTINGSVTNNSSYFTFYFTWSTSQSVDGNYSDITVKTYIKTSNTSHDFDTVGTRNHSITINGTTSSITKRINCVDWANGNPYLIQTATTRVYHNSDGSKSITISARSNGKASSYGYSSSSASAYDATASATVTIDAIPRKSTLSVSNGTLGTAQTLTADRKSSSFTHTLMWESGSYSGTLCTKSTAVSWSFTPALELANGVPNGSMVYVTFKLITYNGTTEIGTYSTSAWMTIPNTDAFKPTVTNVTIDENTTGLAAKFGQYVKSKSTLSVSIAANGVYSSTIKSYSTIITGSGTYSGQSFTSGVLNESGTITITTTVTDSRDRSVSYSTTITVADYYNPKISNLTLNRCTVDGTLSDDGTYLSATCVWDVASVGNANDCLVKLQWLDGTTWTDLSVLEGYNGSSTVVPAQVFNADTNYSVRLIATDYFTSSSLQRPLGSTFTLINFHSSGHGLAIGKISELGNGFEVDLDSQFNKPTYFGSSVRATNDFFYDKFGTQLGNGLTTYASEAIDPNTTTDHLILTNHANAPEGGSWYIKTEFYSTKSDTTNRMQTAYPYSLNKSAYYRYYYDGSWSTWKRIVTADETQNLLWSGSSLMNGSQTITLSDKISNQKTGIALTFSIYANNTTYYNNYNTFFVPKRLVAAYPGVSHCFSILEASGQQARKTLFISDGSIKGYSANGSTSTGGGITYYNGMWTLTAVFGI